MANVTKGKEVLFPLYLTPPTFLHPSPLEILFIPQENYSFIATFNLVKQASPILPMLL